MHDVSNGFTAQNATFCLKAFVNYIMQMLTCAAQNNKFLLCFLLAIAFKIYFNFCNLACNNFFICKKCLTLFV